MARSPGLAASAGLALERRASALFRALGAKTEDDVSLAGNHFDLVVRERSETGTPITSVVECKAYTRPVGVDIVNALASISYLLKQRNLVDRIVIITTSGFTKQARDVAKAHGIELLELAELEQRVASSLHKDAPSDSEVDLEKEEPDEVDPDKEETFRSKPQPPRAFVLMPFGREFEDVYILGIREVAERLNFVVERADNIEHNEDIIQVVREKIRACDIIIADTTGRNPNVFYEIGLAHAIEKPTILICRKGDQIPFDVQSLNHILYESIVELRDKLERRIRATIQLTTR